MSAVNSSDNRKVPPTSMDSGGVAAVAAIFDMDGTLIDNAPYHLKSWQRLYKKYRKGDLTRETYLKQISGVPIKDTLKTLFGADHDEAGLAALLKEKEDFYKEAYKPYLAPINGLENFLSELKDAGVKMALASSATVDDINFVFDGVAIRQYFDVIIDGGMVSKGKPNPQIFLKAAEQLNARPQDCVVFEDSISGIKAGKSAGMKVVGITTSHPAEALTTVDLAISDFAAINLHKMAALLNK